MAERFYSDDSASKHVRGISTSAAFLFSFLERAALLAGLKVVADRLHPAPGQRVLSLVVVNGVFLAGMLLLGLWTLYNVTPAIISFERRLEPKWTPRWLHLVLQGVAFVIAVTVAWELNDALKAFVSELSKASC
jgi:hypothetical protein